MSTLRYRTNYYEDTVQTLNPETGELQQHEICKKFKVSYNRPDDFIMCYLASSGILYKLKPDILLKTFHWLCMHVTIGTNQVALCAALKKQMCAELNYSTVTLYNHLKALKQFVFESEQGEPEHIILVEGGLVTINSKFVWKGDLKKLSEFEIQFKAKFVES